MSYKCFEFAGWLLSITYCFGAIAIGVIRVVSKRHPPQRVHSGGRDRSNYIRASSGIVIVTMAYPLAPQDASKHNFASLSYV